MGKQCNGFIYFVIFVFYLSKQWSTFCGQLKNLSYDIKILIYLHLDIELQILLVNFYIVIETNYLWLLFYFKIMFML